jgi:hypothetical protein
MLLRGGGGAGGLLGDGGGGGPPGLVGAGRPSSVFCRVAEGGEGGGTGPRLLGNAGAGPLGRDFFAARPSNTSRSELALSLIDAALSASFL